MNDLGKIGIPDSILMKPAKLDSTEWEIMKLHTVIGSKILEGSDAEFIQMGQIIALCHHEKWDGSGYPRRLKGQEIPVAARITAMADIFDALTSRRPYRKPYSLAEALSIIRKGRDSHFDPDVFDAFFDIQDEITAIKEQHVEINPQVFDIPELKGLLQTYNSRPNSNSYFRPSSDSR
jgi:putative two-component system response regulator